MNFMPTKCKNCGNDCWSGRDEFDLCTKCQIGDNSPTLWLLTQIYNKLNQPVEVWSKSNRERSCYKSLTYNAITGECVGTDRPRWDPEWVQPKDYISVGVTVVCDNNESRSNTRIDFHCWKDAGSSAVRAPKSVPVQDFHNLVAEGAPYVTLAITSTISFTKENLFFCSKCEKDLPNPPAGQHFAGVYCVPCWMKYQSENSSVCSRCRSPAWDCCC